MSTDPALGSRLAFVQWVALIVGAVGVALCLLWGLIDLPRAFEAYLIGFLCWIGFPIGCLALLMLHHLVAGSWGFAIQRPLEAGAMTMPAMAVLFLPVAAGLWLGVLFPWAVPGYREAHAAEVQSSRQEGPTTSTGRVDQTGSGSSERHARTNHKATYLNVPFFLGRAVGYFGLWCGLAFLLNRWSRDQDRGGDPGATGRLMALSGPGEVLLIVSASFAMIDWGMSLEPKWYSTIYGVMLMTGQALAALALMVIVVANLREHDERLARFDTSQRFHDLGNLMLAFTMLWAYTSFSQFLIIWSGNLTEEIPWYLHRGRGGWQWVALLLAAFQFVLPFVLLLFRDTKRHPRALARVAGLIVAVHLVDVYWLIEPAFSPAQFRLPVPELAAIVGLGGLWLSAFTWQIRGRTLLPVHDPRLDEILAEAHH